MKVICVIPARYASSRLPGKPLADLAGKPLIQWVYERALAAAGIDESYVATDDQRIAAAVRNFGGNVLMPEGDFQSGTDRIAAAVKNIACDAVVNLQGDEPMMSQETLNAAVEVLVSDPLCDVSTAKVRIHDEEEYNNSNVVKVVCAPDNTALYFSRSPIPCRARVKPGSEYAGYYGFKHLGLYVYRREALEAFPGLPPSFLEKIEQLEQLRFLENGYRIKVVESAHDSIGVDTPEDLEAIRNIISVKNEFSPQS